VRNGVKVIFIDSLALVSIAGGGNRLVFVGGGNRLVFVVGLN